jgi:hypothetical protein
MPNALQAQTQVPNAQAQPWGHAQPGTRRPRQPPSRKQVLLCLLVCIGLVLQMQRQLRRQVVAMQRQLRLLLAVLAQSALQVEGHWDLCCQWRLRRCGVRQRQLHVVLGLQAPGLQLRRQPRLLLLLQQLRRAL